MNQQPITVLDNDKAFKKAEELILYMDNTSQFYLNKMDWCRMYINRIENGTFDEDLAMKGMDTLRKKVQASYNEEFREECVKFTANELAEVLAYFLFSVYDEMREILFQRNKSKGV